MFTLDIDNAIALFLLLLGAGILYAVFKYKSVPFSNDPKEVTKELMSRLNPNHSEFRSSIELGKAQAFGRLALETNLALEAFHQALRKQDTVGRLLDVMEMEYRLLVSRHTTLLSAEESTRAGHKGAIDSDMRIEFYEALTLGLATGELGKTLSEVQKQELLGDIHLKQKKLEYEITQNAVMKLDEYKQKRLKAFTEGEDEI